MALLADEPTGNPDGAATVDVLRLFERLRSDSRADGSKGAASSGMLPAHSLYATVVMPLPGSGAEPVMNKRVPSLLSAIATGSTLAEA